MSTQVVSTARVVAAAAQVAAKVKAAFADKEADWVNEAHARRMLRATDGDSDAAVVKLKDAVTWKKGTLDVWRESQAAILPTTETRQIAIGHESRPLVYSGCVNQRPDEIPGMLIACVWDSALQAAGPEAQLDYLLDAHGYQPLLNLNPMPYLSIAQHLDSYFAERFNRIIVLDSPIVLEWLMQMITPLMPAKTKQKLVFIHRRNPEEMKVLHDLCVDQDMKDMVDTLLKMNGEATSSDGREATHKLTNEFVENQRQQRRPRFGFC